MSAWFGSVKHTGRIASLLAITLLFLLQSPFAYADITQDDLNSFINNTPFFDPASECDESQAAGSGSSQATVDPSASNVKNTMSFLTSAPRSLTTQQAAGIIGNLMQESGLNPKSNENGSGPGRGIAQWTVTDRWQGVIKLAQQEHKDPYDLGVQLDYLWQELTTGYAPTLQHLKASTTTDDAVNQFVGPLNFYTSQPAKPTDEVRRKGGFENPGVPAMKSRLKYAADALGTPAATQSGNATLSTGSSCGCPSGSTCDNGPFPPGQGSFTTNGTLPDSDKMIQRAKALADRNSSFFKQTCGRMSDLCYNYCLGATAWAWGYNSSGYERAIYMWNGMVSRHLAHADRNPPVGALLFYDWDGFGHVVVYLGNNTIMSTDVLGTGYVWITDAAKIETGPWKLKYLGWAPPAYLGSKMN